MKAGGQAPAPSLKHRRAQSGFWVVAAAFLVAMAFAALPTPLYPLYAQRDSYPAAAVTIVFSVYAIGVMAALYLGGHLSDRLGRRTILLTALAIEAISSAMFLIWNDLAGLLLARFISGIGTGALMPAATVYLNELRNLSHPGEHGRVAGTVATVVNTGGLGLGPLVGGILAQFAPAPLVTPFVVFTTLFAIALTVCASVPETVEHPIDRSWWPRRVHIPAFARTSFFAAALDTAAAFSVIGLLMALSGSILHQVLEETSLLAVGGVVFVLMTASAVAQVAMGRTSQRSQLRIGAVCMLVGLGVIGLIVRIPSTVLLLAAVAVAGAGVGLIFKAGVSVASAAAERDNRGEVLAVMFLAAYAGLVIPVVTVGLVLLVSPLSVVLPVFALVVMVTVGVASTLVLREQPDQR